MPACVEPLAGEGAKAASGKVSTTDSIYFCQHIAIESTVRHENSRRWVIQAGASSAWCETNNNCVSPSLISTSTKRRISWRFSGSSPCSGSSRISNVGCFTSARTISARRCCPQERLWNGASAVRLSMPRISSHCCTSFAGDPKRPDKCQSNQNSQKESHYAR